MAPARSDLNARDYIWAGILTGAIPFAIGLMTLWVAPWACDASPWLCLLPIALMYISPVAAVFLPLVFLLNCRAAKSLPDGFLVVTLLSAFLVQVIVSGMSFWNSETHMRKIFFVSILIFHKPSWREALSGPSSG